MGGSPNLLIPVRYTGLSSWEAHQHRVPRSSEPGTDFYCPIGTPVLAPADGYIYGYGDTIGPATGRWVGIQFDNGMSFRVMHLSRILKFSGRVSQADLIGLSGATGYGDNDWSWNPNTGGAHAHVTLWPTSLRRFGYNPSTGEPYTIDFMKYAGGSGAGGSEEDDMYTEEDRNRDNQIARDVTWIKSRIGGKDSEASLTSTLSGVAGIVQWIKERIGGSTSTATITDRLRSLQGTSTTAPE